MSDAHQVVGLLEDNDPLWLSAVIALVVSLLFAGLLMRFGSWTLIVAAILGLAVLIGFLPIIFLYGLSYIDSFYDFAPALLYLVGGLLAIIGGIVAFIQGRSDSPRTVANRAEQGTIVATTLAISALLIVSAVLSITERDTVSAADAAGAILVDMKDTRFEPERLEMPAGQAVRLLVTNSDFTIHTFTIEGLGIDIGFGGVQRTINRAAINRCWNLPLQL